MSDKVCRTENVLIIDDNPEAGRAISAYFEHRGANFEGRHMPLSFASNRNELGRQIAVMNPCMIVLDLGIGQENGFDLLRFVRSRSNVPVIITTSTPLDEIDRVIGFELGADDYLEKPFNPRELLARVRTLLRRQELGRGELVRSTKRGDYRFGNWRLQGRSRQVFDPTETSVLLSKAELALLLVFLENPQRTLSREELLQASQIHVVDFDRDFDSLIFRLRRKLERDADSPRIIKAQRGKGYIFTLPVESF
jgi:two-component system OmpR family response regulator